MAFMIPEDKARQGITIEAHRAYVSASGERRAADWTLTCPDGWQFTNGSHTLVEFSREAANEQKRNHPIEQCPADCDCRETDR